MRQKWYVVWVGNNPGIYDSWEECKAQVDGYPGARYKSFNNQTEATEAYRNGDITVRETLRAIARGPRNTINYLAFDDIIADSIAVDGACAGNPGMMEYRGVDVQTGVELFRRGPFPDATNNIGEFLAIVHALAMFHQQGNDHTAIYSDSLTAISWIRQRKCNTKVQRTPGNGLLFQLIQRAEAWLQTHTWKNAIVKWQTDRWGEIPADFGRK